MEQREKCEECNDWRYVNDDGICADCEQDAIDLEDEEDLEDEDP